MSLIFSSLIFLLIYIIFLNPLNLNQNLEKNNQNNKINIISKIIQKNKLDSNVGDNNQEIHKEDFWYIEIPAISLKAPIASGVDFTTLQKYVGHFEETSSNYGNIGLAAHNRGYEINYFENLKNVKKGDEIKYKYEDFEKIYLIDKIEIIRNTDWSYLENTQENKITLITCVENEPNLRRCVQGIEKR